VEVDIVMDGNTSLWKAHDISQQLQDKIEDLPNLERAFVHVDHEWTHPPVIFFGQNSEAEVSSFLFCYRNTERLLGKFCSR